MTEDPSNSLDKAIEKGSERFLETVGTKFAELFSDAFDTVFGGFHYYVEKERFLRKLKYDQFVRSASEKTNDIPEDDLQLPSIPVVCNILEQSKYCVYEEELRSLFSSLLANTASSTYSKFIHPSFADIIRQLSPQDCRVFKYLTFSRQMPIAILSVEKKDLIIEQFLSSDKETPPILTDLQAEGTILLPIVADVPYSVCEPSQLLLSIENLARLGLAQLSFSVLCSETEYESLKELPVVIDAMGSYSLLSGEEFYLHCGTCTVSATGFDFAKVCL